VKPKRIGATGIVVAIVAIVGACAWWFFLGGRGETASPVGGESVSSGVDADSGAAPASKAARGGDAAATADAQVSVRVLSDDWATPLPGATVRVFPFDPRRMQRPTEFTTLRADANGVAKVIGVESGSLWICGPGREPGDDAPGSVRVELRADAAPQTVAVTAKPQLVEVDVIVDAHFAPRDGFGSRIVLHRVDDGSRREWPFPRLVVPGREQVRMFLPAGSFELSLRPIGALLIDGGNSLLIVREGESEERIALLENPKRTMVTLDGIPLEAFPVRVEVIPTDRIDDRRHALEWWGPTAWTSATTSVPSLTGPHRVVATSRTGTWCSREAVLPGEAAATVRLEPATRITLAVESWSAPRDLEMVVDVDDSVVPYTRALLPTFGPEFPALAAPALVGEVFVLRDRDVVLEARAADGEVVWRRSHRSEGAEQVVRVQSARPN
jgi:hypothetical protein